jgi:hypothetical protein
MFRTNFESVHDALHRPESRPRFEPKSKVDLGLGIIVVDMPFAPIVATDDLAT